MKIDRMKWTLLLVTLLAMSLGACGKKGDKKDDGKPAGDMTADMGGDMGAVAPKPAEPEKPKVAIDEAFMKSLKAIVADCEIGPDDTYLSKCKGKLADELVDAYREHKDKKFEDTLDTLAVALTDKDHALNVVAAEFINGMYSNITNVGERAMKFDKDAAGRFLAAVGKVKSPSMLGRLAIAVTYIATLAEQDKALFELIEAQKDIRPYVLGKVMQFGRMRVFPKVQEYAKSTEAPVAAAAVSAPLSMYDTTADEAKVICPWALGFLTSEVDQIFSNAGFNLIRCKGEYIDKLLDEGEKRLKEDKFNRDYYFVFRDICFSMMAGAIKEPGVEAQCDRNYKFLESVAKNKKIDGEFRALALDAIYYQRRDKKTLDVLKKYANDKDAKIKEMVKKDIESLKTHYKVK